MTIDVVSTISSLLNHNPKIKYQMGGERLFGSSPVLDCSAFYFLAHMSEKYYEPNKTWYNTDAVVDDIDNHNIRFDKTTLKDIKQGDCVVYPSSKGKDGKTHAGHIAVVDKYENGKLWGWDCSSSQDGISYRDISFFIRTKGVHYGRFKK